jgi:hypothetical protein
LARTISYFDYKEDYYHGFLTGVLTNCGTVESNDENGLGRTDIVVTDETLTRCVIIEVKHSASLGQMEKDAVDALAQIEAKHCADMYVAQGFDIVKYGIAFYQKQCKILLANKFSTE